MSAEAVPAVKGSKAYPSDTEHWPSQIPFMCKLKRQPDANCKHSSKDREAKRHCIERRQDSYCTMKEVASKPTSVDDCRLALVRCAWVSQGRSFSEKWDAMTTCADGILRGKTAGERPREVSSGWTRRQTATTASQRTARGLPAV